MEFAEFWYIAAQSKNLQPGFAVGVSILDEWIVLFRNENQEAVALQDRCLHRTAQLSKGFVQNGKLTCPYHGWSYSGDGEVINIPSEETLQRKRYAKKYKTIEQDGYIYVQLKENPNILPFRSPSYQQKNYATIRLVNDFKNSVTNCAENFLDIPHTTFVHPIIFRNPKREKMRAEVERTGGHVKVNYLDEKSDFGIFSWFLNPKNKVIVHTDEFFMPNVTTVNYWFGKKHFIITSQSVPLTSTTTRVYTDLTYNYGIWNWFVRPIIRWQGQAIINQDITILNNQGKTIQKYGAQFQNTPADIIHTFIESIQNEIQHGRHPKDLSDKKERIEFWV